jgi:DNA polymerase III epsilon subunit-like protein
MSRIIALDVETTGISPARGDRVIEIGAVVMEGDRITFAHYQKSPFPRIVLLRVTVQNHLPFPAHAGMNLTLSGQKPGAIKQRIVNISPALYRSAKCD